MIWQVMICNMCGRPDVRETKANINKYDYETLWPNIHFVWYKIRTETLETVK